MACLLEWWASKPADRIQKTGISATSVKTTNVLYLRTVILSISLELGLSDLRLFLQRFLEGTVDIAGLLDALHKLGALQG